MDAFDYIDGMQDLLQELSEQAVEMHAMSNYPVWYKEINKKLHIDRYTPELALRTHDTYQKPHQARLVDPSALAVQGHVVKAAELKGMMAGVLSPTEKSHQSAVVQVPAGVDFHVM